MQFDLNLKSLTMSGFEIPPLIHLCPFSGTSISPSRAMGAKLLIEIVIVLPSAARRPGGALKLPQRVRAYPGRQTFLMHLWPENDVWEHSK